MKQSIPAKRQVFGKLMVPLDLGRAYAQCDAGDYDKAGAETGIIAGHQR
jgi:hypothetical protein